MIRDRGWTPALAIVSDARRTQATFEALALGPETALRLDGRIYEASPASILALIGETGEDADSLLVVGHNPGLGMVARLLAVGGAAADLARLQSGFPTSTLAVLCFGSSWSALAETGGTLDALIATDATGARR